MESIAESDVIEWTGEALQAIGSVTLYDEVVCFVEVKNFQCDVPVGLHSIIQIARNHCFTGSVDTGICAKDVVESTTEETTEEGADTPVALDCNGTPINGYELAYYRPYFDLKYEYQGWCNSYPYRTCFNPVRLATTSFFDSIACTETNDDIKSLYNKSRDEYTVVANKKLRFNFQEGQVAIAFTRQQVDEATGYPLILDSYSNTTAITKYITYKVMERHFYAGRQGSETRVSKAEQDWHWYCKQASNEALIPTGIDELQNIKDQRSYLLPRDKYYNFFGNLGDAENRKFNDPDNRNRFYNYGRG